VCRFKLPGPTVDNRNVCARVCVSGYIRLLCVDIVRRPKNRLGKLLMDFGKQIKTSTERHYNNNNNNKIY